MKILILLYTQAEAGAPGFLSRRGEDSAGNLAQTLFGFAQDTLNIQIDAEHQLRTQSLQEDLRWRAFKSADSLTQAVRAANSLFSDVLLFSGEHFRTLKTAEPVSQMCALPVCVDRRLDRCSEDTPASGTLKDAMTEIIDRHVAPLETKPRCIWIATSQRALAEWLKEIMDAQKWAECMDVLKKSSNDDSLPTVFACGFEQSQPGVRSWIVD